MPRRLYAFILIGMLIPAMALGVADEQRPNDSGENVKQVDSQKQGVDKVLNLLDEDSVRVRSEIQKRPLDFAARQDLMQHFLDLMHTYEETLTNVRARFQRKVVGLYKGASLDMVNKILENEEMAGYLQAAVANEYEAIQYYKRLSSLKKYAAENIAVRTEATQHDIPPAQHPNQGLAVEAPRKKLFLASLAQESEAYQNEIEELMERLRRQAEADERAQKLIQSRSAMARNKGMLPWPLKGKVTRKFGRYNQGESIQISRGLDIKAAAGTDVKCVFKGRIVYVGWIVNVGNTVIVDHGTGFFSIYGRIQNVLKKQGDEVAMNEPIAQLGPGAGDQAPSLHFEIRSNGKAQDPGHWLIR